MKFVSHMSASIRREPFLWGILALAFFLRVVAIGYGLPLIVVADEAPFTLAALKMLQLHTLIPSLHLGEFSTILYYPPYVSYLLLAPFSAIIGVEYLLWHGDPALFQAHLLSDLSPFFIAARLVSVLFGVVSVYLVYRIAESLFRSRVAATAAAFLLATSLLHEALSMVGRQWVPVSSVFLVVLFILTRGELPLGRRYVGAFMAAGVGMGVSFIAALACPLIGLYYLVYDAPPLRRIFRDWLPMVSGALLFFALTGVAWLLYHGGNSFAGSLSLTEAKSLGGYLGSFPLVASLVTFSEPVLVGLALAGLALSAVWYRRVAILIASFVVLYISTFYIVFRFSPRFILPLVPLLAILGGYAVARLWNSRSRFVILALLAVPLVLSLRLDFLALQGDTRTLAREWVLEHLNAKDKILVYASGTRLPTSAESVEELRALDLAAVRKTDEAEATLEKSGVPHALNNLTEINESALMRLPAYARDHAYAYLFFEPRSAVTAPTSKIFAEFAESATIVQKFVGFGTDDAAIADSSFLAPFTELFRTRLLGPDIVIYRLH